MESYIKFTFYMGSFALVVRLFALAFGNYPRRQVYERWEDVAGIVLQGGFMLWAASLVYFHS